MAWSLEHIRKCKGNIELTKQFCFEVDLEFYCELKKGVEVPKINSVSLRDEVTDKYKEGFKKWWCKEIPDISDEEFEEWLAYEVAKFRYDPPKKTRIQKGDN